MNIVVPHKFKPRPYQLPFLKAMDSGIKRAVLVWNRRSGKDKACFNLMIKKAFERVGTYFYFLPEYTQARKVVWDNIDSDGFRMLDHIPRELIAKKNETTLKIELINGSVIQLLGADTFSSSGVGTNPVGVVLSEYSVNKPEVWDFIRPILAVNGGWAIFNFTPRGQNHAYKLLQQNKDNPDWFTQLLTVDDTQVLTTAQLDEERRAGMSQAMIDQEFYCKFIESATSFFRDIDQICTVKEESNTGNAYQMGVDLARKVDYTVISVINLNTFEQVYLDRFNQMDWNLQKAKIEAVYLRYGRPKGYIDATGVGDPIHSDLQSRGIDLTPYIFTETSRRDLLTNLTLKMEQRAIALQNNPVLKEELEYFQFELVNNKIKVKVPDGLHDDTVMGTALSVWELPHKPIPFIGGMNYQTQGVAPMNVEWGF